uniref:PDZ domain-containing protein n=1 Tax=Hyaloperonospora arabidopsidis (strain Emoy2) TaxID=559515 RepID=M4BWW6_HYAAE
MQDSTTVNDGTISASPVPVQTRSRVKTKSRRRRTCESTSCSSTPSSSSSSSSFSSSSFFSTSSSEFSLPLASAPRTVEFLWSGCSAPGFTLKRKRSGAIFVSTVTHETQMATTLRVGSEFKLVGGFPVNRLTLQDVKKVMLLAPKPVSLVFVNIDDVVIENVNTNVDKDASTRMNGTMLTVARRKLSSSLSTTGPSLTSPMHSTRSLRRSVSLDSSNVQDSSSNSSSSREPRDRDRCMKERKVSKLQMALHRVNQLLNRPVRQAGLHVAVGKSIVV